MNIEKLKEKLESINSIIEIEYKNEKQIGVLDGLSGIALFQFYYSKYLNVDEHADLGIEIITNCIAKINEGYKYPTFCSGIAGSGWVLDHLEQEGFITVDNDLLLSDLDQFIYELLISDMNEKKYDFLHSSIGYAFYFLNRYKNTKSNSLKNKYNEILIEFIHLLEEISENENENELKWESELNMDTKERGYNFSLSHGMSSIIGILTKLYEFDEFKNITEHMLKGAINFLISFKNKKEDSLSLFPSWVSKNELISYNSRLAWCYGDLGVGLRLLYASKVLNDKELECEALKILKYSAKKRKKEESLVKDAALCHGSFGNAQIFNRIYKETKDSIFKDAAIFWIQDGLDLAVHQDGFAGYKRWTPEGWYSDISLLNGIAGIGLVILDHISDFDSNWDECLMIS